MVVGKAGDLGEMSDTNHLIFGSKGLKAAGDTFGGAASDACVDFIEDQSARGRIWVRFFAGEARLESEGNAGKFAAGCHTFERSRFFPGVRGYQKLHTVGTGL